VKKFCSIAALVIVSSALAFQNTDSRIFRSTTRLIQVTVIASDKDGNPVTDLRKEDFDLLEDGQRQNVAVFIPDRDRIVIRPALPRNEFNNELPAANSARSGYTLILIDWRNSSMSRRINSHQQVLRLLQQVATSDLVALCVLDRDLRVVQDFTSDRGELVRRLSATFVGLAEGPPKRSAAEDSSVAPVSHEVERNPIADRAEAINIGIQVRQRSLDTIAALEQVASYLRSAPGRKSMIWLTSGFPAAPEFKAAINRMSQRFNDADIAVYPVDARGFIAGAAVRGFSSEADLAGINQAMMKEIADKTGGRAFYNDNDIENAMRGALDDARFSYTLGYYPANSKNDGAYRNLSVKTSRPGVTLRYRTGYAAENDSEPKAAAQIDLQQVFGSPLDATALPLSAHAVKANNKLDVFLRIDPSILTLRQENGTRKGAVSVFYSFRPANANGKIQIFSELNKLELPEAQYVKLLQLGPRTFRKQIPIPEKAEALRLAVRDEGSGLVGSVTIPLAAVH